MEQNAKAHVPACDSSLCNEACALQGTWCVLAVTCWQGTGEDQGTGGGLSTWAQSPPPKQDGRSGLKRAPVVGSSMGPGEGDGSGSCKVLFW